ncbi:hypothetical protein ABZ722_18305 [Streptomyces longwoodensis]|uniref:hypothetical protein n=1 Tax=Streptomyces longwoodensis TaxID=68231 RepID=UPI0033C20C7C
MSALRTSRTAGSECPVRSSVRIAPVDFALPGATGASCCRALSRRPSSASPSSAAPSSVMPGPVAAWTGAPGRAPLRLLVYLPL